MHTCSTIQSNTEGQSKICISRNTVYKNCTKTQNIQKIKGINKNTPVINMSDFKMIAKFHLITREELFL